MTHPTNKAYRVRAVHCDYRSSDEEVYQALKRATDPLDRAWEKLGRARRIGIKFNQDWVAERVVIPRGTPPAVGQRPGGAGGAAPAAGAHPRGNLRDRCGRGRHLGRGRLTDRAQPCCRCCANSTCRSIEGHHEPVTLGQCARRRVDVRALPGPPALDRGGRGDLGAEAEEPRVHGHHPVPEEPVRPDAHAAGWPAAPLLPPPGAHALHAGRPGAHLSTRR